MRVFMTGATGFVGLNIVEALLGLGHEVVCYLRSGARRQYLERMPVSLVTGALGDEVALATAMRGAECVVHTAGNTSCDWRDIAALRAANVESTRVILAAARRNGVRRIVYTSSTATIGSSTQAPGANEQQALSGWRADSPYAQTKQEAEAILLGADGIESVVLNPAEVVGPWDHSLQWGRIVLAVAAGRLPFVPPGAGSFAPASAVAQAHVAALSRGRSGQRYILGGEALSFARFIELAAEACGTTAKPLNQAPYRLLQLEALLRERLRAVGVRPPAVDAYRMRVFGGRHFFDDRLARSELGYAPQPVREAIAAAHRWYQENGFLARPEVRPSSLPANPLQESSPV